MLVSRSDPGNQVIVHDILRLKGRKEGKDTRIKNSKQFLRVLEDESKLGNVKGLSLTSDISLTTLESRNLNAMHKSLRILDLGNWVNFDGDACNRSFKNLRFLKLGDLAVFPFADASKLEKLAVFHNRSKPGMCLPQLPRTLKVIFHQVPELDCEAFENLPLQNLRLLEEFKVESEKPVKLPQGLKLPPSLKVLQLPKCKQLPESFSHLTALESLDLDDCDMESLPQGFAHLAKLKELSMKNCEWLTSLPEGFGSLRSLTRLSLNRCTRLERLAADFGMLSSLKELGMRNCKNLKELPEDISGLTSLQRLDLNGCEKLERLPESFGTLSMQTLSLHYLHCLNELPQSFGKLPSLTALKLWQCDSLACLPDSFGKLRCLTVLELQDCELLVCLPDSFVKLAMLKTLTIKRCLELCRLPKDFGRLSSLERMEVELCPRMEELPQGFGALPALKSLTLKNCSALVKLVEGFGQLACLEELYLKCKSLSCFPDDFGNLKRLNHLRVSWCTRLETLPHDFENLVSLRAVKFATCPMLEARALDTILKLKRCYSVSIEGSGELQKRWDEIQHEEEQYPILMYSDYMRRTPTKRADRVALFHGQRIELNTSRDELIEHKSIQLDKEITTVAVIHCAVDFNKQDLLQRVVEIAKAKAASSRQLRILYVRKIKLDGEIERAMDEGEERESMTQILKKLPHGSLAIPSTDTKRLLLIQHLFFYYSANEELACFMADVGVDDKGLPTLKAP
ncbi:hypothetical protein KI387_027942 [Taxus chinensis]|uniref:Disease resistance R13L4/SHOC-2-like LRR domain-containing protein n=1 Tax=Taxus chinensis TaxID=29808 RepID=A0AA38L9Z7_TAXCH|nr:hypothetical protein KI387_027942 [Taxus chinensis]